MTKILITGAGGYIGSVATYIFLQNGFKVVAVDNFSTGFRKPLEVLQEKFGKDKLKIYELDLNDNLSTLFSDEKNIDCVVHYAACCLVDESMKNPQKYFQSNVCGSQNLLSAMIATNIKKIVFSSTSAVYGEALHMPVNEDHPTSPINPYGASKRMTEELIQWYERLLDLKFVILRYFNVTGASDDGLIGDSKKPSVLLIQNAVRGALGIEPFHLTCPEVDTPDKSPIRDYVNVVDLNEAHLLAVNHLLSGKGSQIINVGTGSGNSVLEIVNQVEQITGQKIDAQKATPREGEHAKMIASIEKAKEVLDWQPKRSIEDSVKSLVSWYNSHPQGWER